MDILSLVSFISGHNQSIDISSNTPVALTIKIGGSLANTELTKAILDNLITLQNGSDFADGTNSHTHDARYYTQSQISSSSFGSAGASLVGVSGIPSHYFPATPDVEAHLQGIDAALASAGGSNFLDSMFRVQNDPDNTKQIALSAVNISTATTRILTMANFDVDLAALTDANIASGAAIAYSKLSLANSIVNADINSSAAIAYSKLNLAGSIVNADVSNSAAIAYSKLALSNSIVNADISASAAIAYSKLNLLASIVNADISPSAAIAYSKLALSNSIVDSDINVSAAISYSKLNLLASIVNADISPSAAIAYSKLNLVGSIVNADINAAAAIAYSKLALSNSIVDADIAAAAAISYSKLAALTINRALVSDGSGFVSVATTTSTEIGYVNGVTSALQPQINGKLSLSGGTMSGQINMGGFQIINGADPTTASAFATKNYVDNAINGLSWKMPAYVATTANITLSGEQTLDGFLTSASRVLVKNQITPSQNGLYLSGAGAWTRTTDMDSLTPLDEFNGAAVFVLNGTLYGGKGFVEISTVTVVGTDPVNFAQFSSAGAYIGGNGILITGSTIAVNLATNSGLFFSTSQLSIQLADSTLALSGSGIAVATGGITNTQINASAAIAYSKLNLSGSIVNADINAAAAIVYSKLNLVGQIVNADINASAAIAYSKLALSNSIVNADINASAAIAYSKLNLALSIVNADIAVGAAIVYSKLSLTNSIVNADIAAAAAIAYSKLNLTGSIVNADISASAAIVYSKLSLANSIINADINTAAAIAYSKLNLALSIVNADIAVGAAIAYAKLNLAGSIVNADIATGAAIAYTKLSLTGSIVNADIAAGAAIAYNKLATLTANRALVSDGSGFVSVATTTATEIGYVNGVTSAIQGQFSGKASIALDNLASVAINTSLLPGVDNSIDVGSAAKRFANVHAVSHLMYGSTSGAITHQAADATTSYTIKWPATQVAGTTVLQKDASGNLSWATATSFNGRANGTATTLSAATSSKVVTFSSTLGTTNYAVIAIMNNLVDANPQFQPITITAKSATGFTATWNAPTDSANYILEYIAIPNA